MSKAEKLAEWEAYLKKTQKKFEDKNHELEKKSHNLAQLQKELQVDRESLIRES